MGIDERGRIAAEIFDQNGHQTSPGMLIAEPTMLAPWIAA
jgi:hypothetical protein